MNRVFWLACLVLAAVSSLSAQEPKLRITLKGHADSVDSVVFSPDGRTLASASRDQTIKLWDVVTGNNIATLKAKGDDDDAVEILNVAFSPDGKTLASGSGDKTIKVWDVANGRDIATLSGHTALVKSVAFSPDGTTLASGSSDKTIKLWDVKPIKDAGK